MENRTRKLIFLILSFLVPILIVCCSMRVWTMDLKTPPSLSGDWVLGMRVLKSMEEDGIMGHFFAFRMGAPDVATILDTPYQDFTSAITLLAADLILNNGVSAFYCIYFLNYGLASLFTFCVMKKLKVSNILSCTAGIVYSIAPYHFLRGLGHFELSNIAVIPIGIWLAFIILNEKIEIIITHENKRRLNKNVIGILFGSIYLGFSYGYYPVFMIIVMGIAVITKMLRERSFKPIYKEAIPIYVTAFFLALQTLPNIVFNYMHGANKAVANRIPVHSEVLGLRLIQMLIPNANTHFKFLKPLTDIYNSQATDLNENSFAALGIITSIAFLSLCVWLIYSFVSKRNLTISNNMDFLSLATLTLFLVCTYGGFSAIIAYFVSTKIRCWNRGSIVIACLSIIGGTVLLHYFLEKIQGIKKTVIQVLISFIVLVIAICDQVPVYSVDWQKDLQSTSLNYQKYFSTLEDGMPENAMVYQLPFIESYETEQKFHEGDYSGSIPYIVTNHVRFSYGGTTGRDDSARNLFIDCGISSEFIKGIKESGFTGVLVDTYAYSDEGKMMHQFYSAELSIPPLVSEDGRYYYYSLDNISPAFIEDKTIKDYRTTQLLDILDLPESDYEIARAYLETGNIETFIEKTKEKVLPNEVLMNDEEFISVCFKNILDRDADEEGIKSWIKFLDENSRDEAIKIFLTCDEFTSKLQ